MKAQPYYFNRNYDYPWPGAGYVASTAETDSFYFTVGVANGFTDGGPHFFKLSKTGDTLLTRVYYKPITGYAGTGISGSVFEKDSFVYFSGSEDTASNRDIVFYKFNYDGDTVWTRRYAWSAGENGNRCFPTADGGFAIIGWTQSFGNGSSDFILLKTDSSGTLQWFQTYGTSTVEDGVSGQQTLDGGFILSGSKNNQFYIIKTDSVGNQQWDMAYPNTKGVCFLTQLPDSGYVLSGTTEISLDEQGCLIRTDKNGTEVWRNNYGDPGKYNLLYSIPIILWDGSIVCSGISENTSGTNPVGWLLKTDAQGNQMWSRTYFKNSSANNEIYDVKLCSDNGFIMSGYTMMASQDAWLVKVDSNGCLIPNCNVGTQEWETGTLHFFVYPNPARSDITINTDPLPESCVLEIINTHGQIIRRVEPKPMQTEHALNLSGHGAGLYYLLMKDKTGAMLRAVKFVLKE